MTTLDFRTELVENTFAYSNHYSFNHLRETGLCFSMEKNYPYILRSEMGDDCELHFCCSPQLRNRVLSGKKLKEVMDSSPLPIWIRVRNRDYLIGKGFLSEYNAPREKVGKLLFVACANSETVSNIGEVKFFIARRLYEEDHKAFHPIIKEILATHTGDVTICSEVLDYMGVKIELPPGGSIATRKKYTDLLVEATIKRTFEKLNPSERAAEDRPTSIIVSNDDDYSPW